MIIIIFESKRIRVEYRRGIIKSENGAEREAGE